ncbi:MAG: hypothetical protein H6673_04720 [Anaerolineales bacterium]|nr:hypothetical protein [Anaerolineales bacterium]
MLDQLTSANFAPHLHSTFHIHYDNGQILEVKLVAIQEFAEHADQPRQAFSLTFQSTEKSFYLKQAIYTLAHEQMGQMDLFIVPLGPDQAGMNYEVIFS